MNKTTQNKLLTNGSLVYIVNHNNTCAAHFLWTQLIIFINIFEVVFSEIVFYTIPSNTDNFWTDLFDS